MPRYKTKKFREPDLDKLTTFVSRLKPGELRSFINISRHFQGTDVGYGDKHRTPYKKVLPGVFEDIQNATSGAQLSAAMVSESFQHRDDPSFHRGGGFIDGMSSLLHTGYNYLSSAVAPLGWLQDRWDDAWNYRKSSQIPISIKRQVDGLAQAKLAPSKRKDTLHGWKLDRKLSSDRVAVYVDEKHRETHCIIRGTDKTSVSDIANDAKILFQGSPDLHGVRETLLDVSKEYGATMDMSCLGFSLGGSMLTKIFTDESQGDDKKLLDDYDSLLLVNPGGSPFTGEEPVKQILADDRSQLLSNRSDVISSIFTTNSDPEKSYYGDHSWGPLESHKFEQFGTEPETWRESDKPAVGWEEAAAAVGMG